MHECINITNHTTETYITLWNSKCKFFFAYLIARYTEEGKVNFWPCFITFIEVKLFCFNAHLIEQAFIEAVMVCRRKTVEERTNESNVNQILSPFIGTTKT